jgi:hypothetical protein
VNQAAAAVELVRIRVLEITPAPEQGLFLDKAA